MSLQEGMAREFQRKWTKKVWSTPLTLEPVQSQQKPTVGPTTINRQQSKLVLITIDQNQVPQIKSFFGGQEIKQMLIFCERSWHRTAMCPPRAPSQTKPRCSAVFFEMTRYDKAKSSGQQKSVDLLPPCHFSLPNCLILHQAMN